MQVYDTVKNMLDNSFWISTLEPHKVTQVIFPKGYTLNDKFVYMGYGLNLTPTMSYQPNISFYDVQIDVNGKFYLPMRHSVSLNPDKIVFSNGEVWNRVKSIPPNRSVDYLSLAEVAKRNINNSTYLYNKMMPIYGSHPVVPGQQFPQQTPM
jgi:hypothetical protein